MTPHAFIIGWAALATWICGPCEPYVDSCATAMDFDASGTIDLRDVAEFQNRFGCDAAINECGIIWWEWRED